LKIISVQLLIVIKFKHEMQALPTLI